MPTRTPRIPTIVLVDDDAALRLALSFVLELDGFRVEPLDSGEDLLNWPQPAPPACLLVDQNLSGMSGIEALSRLRARAMALPALLMTSYPSPRLRQSAEELGITIIEKPLLDDMLVAEIRAVLAQ